MRLVIDPLPDALRSLPLLAACLCLATGCSREPAFDAVDPEPGVDRIATAALRGDRLVGISIAIARDGEVVLEKGYGFEDIEASRPMSPASVHDYYSVAKHMTAAVLLRLAERGVVDLDAPATNYLPAVDFEGAPVTTRQLLQHMSGLVDAPFDETRPPAHVSRPPRAGERLDWPNESTRMAPPGTTWIYSNGGYIVPGLVAEAAAGEPLATLIETHLRAPLGLSHFHHCSLVERVQEYTFADGKRSRIPYIDPGWLPGPICGTVGDLVRWWQGLRAGRVIGGDALEAMFTPAAMQRNGVSARFGYGLGVRMGGFHGHRKIGHTGSGGGGTSVLAEYPDDGLVIAVITNTAGEGAPDALDIEADIAKLLLGTGLVPAKSQPAPTRLLKAAPGHYVSPLASLCVEVRDGAVMRSMDDAAPARLVYVGDGRFRESVDGPGEEYFLGIQDGKAQWFAYDRQGMPSDLAFRSGDSCP